jgi:hypothetical protein
MGEYYNILITVLACVFGAWVTIVVARYGDVMKYIIKPHIVIEEPTFDYRAWVPLEENDYFTTAGTATHESNKYRLENGQLSKDDIKMRLFIHFPIHNISDGADIFYTAKNVYGTLDYYKLDGTPIKYNFNARWEDKKQLSPIENKDEEESLKMNVSPLKIKKLDVASEAIGGCWYAMNNRSYDNPENSEIPGNKLDFDGFIVRLVLCGDNIKRQEKTYEVRSQFMSYPIFIELKDFEPK